MRRIPPLAAVRVFEAAARHESFTLAGEELGMTQAAVSYQIKLLEERVGAALFVRERRRVRLSEAGRRAAPLLSNAFDTIAEAFAAARTENETVLSISAPTTWGTLWLAARLGGFQIEQPQLAVRVSIDNQIIDFARDAIDVAVRAGKGPWPGIHAEFLVRHHFTPMCSPEFRAQHGGIADPALLLEVPRISPHDDWWTLWLEGVGIEAGDAARSPGIRFDSQAVDGSAALAGHGVAMLTPMLWPRDIAAGRLVQLFPHVGFDGLSVWIVWPAGRKPSPKVRLFRDWLVREIAGDAPVMPDGALVAP